MSHLELAQSKRLSGCAGCDEKSSSQLTKVEVLTGRGYRELTFCQSCYEFVKGSMVIRNANRR